jgi:hypothetical protein
MSFSFEVKDNANRHNSRRRQSRENWSNSKCRKNNENDENNERILMCRIIIFLDRVNFFDDEIFNWEIVIDCWRNCLSTRFFRIRRRMHDKNNQFFDVFIQSISWSIHRNREKILHDFHQMNVFDYFFNNLIVEKKFIIIIINDVIENKFIKFALISSCFQCFLYRFAFIIECFTLDLLKRERMHKLIFAIKSSFFVQLKQQFIFYRRKNIFFMSSSLKVARIILRIQIFSLTMR